MYPAGFGYQETLGTQSFKWGLELGKRRQRMQKDDQDPVELRRHFSEMPYLGCSGQDRMGQQ